MSTESELTRELCEQLEDCGAYIKAHVASYMNASGWADRWICHRLWHGHLEFKGPTTKLEPLQAKRIREICARQPGTAFVCRFVQVSEDLGGGFFTRVEDADGRVLGAALEGAYNITAREPGDREYVMCGAQCSNALALLRLLTDLRKQLRNAV